MHGTELQIGDVVWEKALPVLARRSLHAQPAWHSLTCALPLYAEVGVRLAGGGLGTPDVGLFLGVSFDQVVAPAEAALHCRPSASSLGKSCLLLLLLAL